jgi:hypothetical protein
MLRGASSIFFFICDWLVGTLSGPKGPFFAILRRFFYCSVATACKNPLCLAKNGRFFVSDATTQPSYLYFLTTTKVARCMVSQGPFFANNFEGNAGFRL